MAQNVQTWPKTAKKLLKKKKCLILAQYKAAIVVGHATTVYNMHPGTFDFQNGQKLKKINA